eukprot:10335751-Lingulodinium_polyedra.AAC.1
MAGVHYSLYARNHGVSCQVVGAIPRFARCAHYPPALFGVSQHWGLRVWLFWNVLRLCVVQNSRPDHPLVRGVLSARA